MMGVEYGMSDYERQLMDLAKKGNIEAFEELAESYYKKVYNIIFRHFGDEADVSSLTQEVFVRVFKSLKNQTGDCLLAVSVYKSAGEVCREVQSGIKLIS